MHGNESKKSFGELPTLGHEEPAEPEASVEGPSWSERGLSEAETLPPTEGIRDDGRTAVARRWTAGETILDRYVVERELGQGGMGVVYGCLDKVGGVRVAVKCLPPELSHNSVEMEEVRENFQLVYGLSHPNIAGVRQLERDGRGEYYLVMEEASGENLRRWLRAKWKAGGVPLAEAVAVLRQVAAALDYAHGKKVVHRDVKPGNVMIDGRTGEVKVLDFGLASQIRTSMSRASHASRGTSGTGPYMAPEQWQGKQQDGAADQYALGVMAYEMLAGHLPFEGSELAVLKDAVLHGRTDPIPGLPKGAMAALRRAMAKRKEERFSSCGEFVAALAGRGWRLAGGGPLRHKGLIAGVVAALVLAAGVVAGVWMWRDGGKGAGEGERRENADAKAVRPAGLPHGRPAEKPDASAEEVERREEERASAEGNETAEEATPGIGAIEWNDRAQEGGDGVNGSEENALREAAIRAGHAAWAARKKADAVDGARLGLSSYKRAWETALEGKGAFENARFKEAAEAWNAAEEAYGAAETEARAEKAGQGLKVAQEAARRGAWDEVLVAAGEVLALEPGNAEAQRLEKSAKAKCKPVLLVSATLQGGGADPSGEPGAKLKVGTKTYLLPKSIDCSAVSAFGPGEVTLEKDGKTYSGTLARMEIDWKGKKPVAVALAERKAGEAAGVARPEGTPLGTKTITLPGGTEMEMVWCPAGDFTMGSPPGESGRFGGETPHRVVLTEGFWMAKYEVTQKQWTSVMETTVGQQRDKGDASLSLRGEGDDYPMYCVSWDEAREFCRKAGHGLQLPTEAQWEYACRAGKTGEYGGTGRLEGMGWYSGNSGRQTNPVGKKRPNAWGLHDMHGNVWEWCADWDGAYPSGVVTNPAGPGSGLYHINRGGSWSSVAKHCRSAFRAEGSPGSRDYNLGFRPVSTSP